MIWAAALLYSTSLPMSALSAAKERQQARRERDLPGSLTISGVTYAGGGLFLGPLEQVQAQDGAGWISMQRFTLIVRKTAMPTPPAKKRTFTSSGHTWRVDEVAGQSPSSIVWIIKAIRFPDPPAGP